jgi:hypothetical protein
MMITSAAVISGFAPGGTYSDRHYVHEYVSIHTSTLGRELKERQEAPMAPRRAVVL